MKNSLQINRSDFSGTTFRRLDELNWQNSFETAPDIIKASLKERINKPESLIYTLHEGPDIVGITDGILSLNTETVDYKDGQQFTLTIAELRITAKQTNQRDLFKILLENYVSIALDQKSISTIRSVVELCRVDVFIDCGFQVMHALQHTNQIEVAFELKSVRDCDMLQIDAFTRVSFGGNPAAVVLIRGSYQDQSSEWMQLVAKENNLSETAFVIKGSTGGFTIRWFTPSVEVELCGHATLAAAFALYEEGLVAPNEIIQFNTLYSGVLTATMNPMSRFIKLDFPLLRVTQLQLNPLAMNALLSSFHIAESDVIFTGTGLYDIIIELAPTAFASITTIDFHELRKLETRGVVISCAAPKRSGAANTFNIAADTDFISRCFFPRIGIDEDPVTGSAHCELADYWSAKLGEVSNLLGYQASDRGGYVSLSVVGERVNLSGPCVTVIRSKIVAR